jgi:hypothetical protein
MKEIIIKMSENDYTVYKDFIQDKVRPDHYNHRNGIYRYGAFVNDIYGKRIIDSDNGLETDNNVQKLKEILNTLSIRPEAIFISDDHIEIIWASRKYAIVKSWRQYMSLSLEFTKYIDNIDFTNLLINNGAFEDDPNFSQDMKTCKKHYHPHFTMKYFGNVEPEIRILDFRQKK